MGLALVIGVVMFLRFFFAGGSTGEESKLKEVVKSQKAAIPAIAQAPGAQPATVVTKVVDTPKSKEKMPAGVQYILDMAANARARHAGWYGHRDIVEFRASGRAGARQIHYGAAVGAGLVRKTDRVWCAAVSERP